jgi:hypothetical protein
MLAAVDFFGSDAAVEAAAATGAVLPVALVAVLAAESRLVIPVLIWINCSRLFTPTSCVMYAFGSVGWVGSWFFNSPTSKVRKSVLVIVEPEAAAPEVLDVVAPVAAGAAVDRAAALADVKSAFAVEAAFGASAVATAWDAARFTCERFVSICSPRFQRFVSVPPGVEALGVNLLAAITP